MKCAQYSFKAHVWIYPGESANWHFVTVPKNISATIDKRHHDHKKGWGSLPVSVSLGDTTWDTSIFPDKRSSTYLLPLKASVRKSEGIFDTDQISVTFTIRE